MTYYKATKCGQQFLIEVRHGENAMWHPLVEWAAFVGPRVIRLDSKMDADWYLYYFAVKGSPE